MIAMTCRIRLLPVVALWLCGVICLSSCAKVWEIGQKLKAPEPVVPELAELVPDVVEELEIPPPPEEDLVPMVNIDAQVSILGYHDFSTSRRATDMVMHPSKLREQMEALRKSEVPVIPMSDYLAWRKGEKRIPDPCVVITIDDGWKGVYTDAFPIFREYGYPFSIYLYRDYIGGAGRSLAYEDIEEMLRHGCEIGSHSVSHSDMTKSRPDYEAWLREELLESLEFLRDKFGVAKVLPVFAYPYGKYNAKVVELAEAYGYELAVTVAPKKAGHGLPGLEVGRYIVHGNDDSNFRHAMTFRGSAVAGGDLIAGGTEGGGASQVRTWPGDQESIGTRLPRIEADLSGVDGVVPGSLAMEISGFGSVPCEFDAASGRLSYQMPEPLRSERCRVTVKLQRRGKPKPESFSWSFLLDRQALYLEESLQANPLPPYPEVGGQSAGRPAG